MAEMDVVKHEIHLGSNDEDVKRVVIKQANDYTHLLEIRLYTDDDQYVLDPTWGYSINMKKADGTYIVNTSNITVKDVGTQEDPDWVIEVVCTAQMLSCPGNAKADLIVYNDGQALFTNTFYIYIEDDVVPGQIVTSQDEFLSLVDALRIIDEYKQQAHDSAENAAQSESNASQSAQNSASYEEQIIAIFNSLTGYEQQVQDLLNSATADANYIMAMKDQLQGNIDEINSQIQSLQEQVEDILTNVVANVNQIYDEILSTKTAIDDIANQINVLFDTANEKVAELNAKIQDIDEKLLDVNSKYDQFMTNIDDAEDKIAQIVEYAGEAETLIENMRSDNDEIEGIKTAANANANAIADDYMEAEELLEKLRELVKKAEESGFLFDPIIISDEEPEEDAQTTDDAWLQPYSDEPEPGPEPPEPEPVVIETIPSQSGTLTYDGTEQAPTWANYNSEELDKVETAQTNAGTYSSTFTPNSGYVWSDGTNDTKTVQWSIGKANGSATLSKNSVSIDEGETDTITISNATGTVSVLSNDTSIATATLSDSTITVGGVEDGDTTISVTIAESLNYEEASITITVSIIAVVQYTWTAKTWNGLTDFDGDGIWTDDNNVYYSNGSNNQYVLNKSTSTWTAKTWNGNQPVYGKNIWTDGDDIYYSDGSSQYILNKSTSTWNAKTWDIAITYGDCIWTDGNNIYYSANSYQYVLNKSTSTWDEMTWDDNRPDIGGNIWTDGDNIYYSAGSKQYVLNKSTSTWDVKNWNGINPTGQYIWADDDNIYYSIGSDQYILNKVTSTWDAKTWNISIPFGMNIWTDGDNTYYSYGSEDHYVLVAS